MQSRTAYTLNINGQLLSLQHPLVMGILNVTTESFYAQSRAFTTTAIEQRAKEILNEGAAIIDIGGCSTKPGLAPVSEDEEMQRLATALTAVRNILPEAIISVDTFRASIAEHCVKEFGVQIINDVSGGKADARMFDTVANLQVPYILTSNESHTLMHSLAASIDRLHLLGVKDIIVDPGFGFGKTLDENYLFMSHLEELHLLDCPLLVGVSRKSMIYNLLNTTPDQSLNGTTALHAIALMKGAHILRVHDVRAALETVKIVEKIGNTNLTNQNG